MPLFVKACIVALRGCEREIDGDDIVYHNYYDIAIAGLTDSDVMVRSWQRSSQEPPWPRAKGATYSEQARSGRAR